MSEQRISATYRLRETAGGAARRAESLALEQSIEMPAEAVADRRILEQVAARVERIETADESSVATLSLSVDTVGEDAGQLLNMLFGNCSLQPDVELLDVDVPESLARRFGGPNHGIEGLRQMTGAFGRPLTCTALKPIGSSTAQLAGLCSIFARAGIDVIKDDHGWANQASSPFAQRVVACQQAVQDVNAASGGRTIYAPSLYGSAMQMRHQIETAQSLGVRLVLIAPMLCGVATLQELKSAFPQVAFLAHPALAGAGRIRPRALLGKLFRLFGADAVIFPNHGGRFGYTAAECSAIADSGRLPWHGLRPSMPVPAGGMAVERVPEIKRQYGNDSMLLIGGSLLIAGQHLAGRSRAFVETVAAADEIAA